jgi:hypothetical protein
MKSAASRFAIWSLAILVGMAVLSADDRALKKGEFIFTSAHAVRGRPATPLSYAGVARRTTRRAYVAGAASSRRCVQVADAYGRVVTRCY